LKMKYIEYPALSRLAQSLTHEGPECSVHTRLEAYSCKNIKRDKKLFKSLETAYKDEASHSPPGPSWLALDAEAEMTPFGPIDRHASRKTLYLLIATLNVAFPDHDFSDVRPSHFSKEESGASVLNALSTTLVAPHRAGINVPRTYSSYPSSSPDFFPNSVPTSSSPYEQRIPSPLAPPAYVSGTHPTVFRQIDEVIGLADCEVFSYAPDLEADPHAGDFSDDEDDVGSPGEDDDESPVGEEETFEFDDYDVDEAPLSHSTHSTGYYNHNRADVLVPRTISPVSFRSRRRGALLWSSHWFFLNRKQKRILFISIWSRTKSMSMSWTEEDSMSAELTTRPERFLGWEGAAGAGARAMGLLVA
jgi:hypothetical protein